MGRHTLRSRKQDHQIFVPPPPSGQCATPTFNPPGGTYNSAQAVTLATSTPGASIRYTTDGTTPTSSSALYSSPLSIASSQQVNAIAILSGLTDSLVGTAQYTLKVDTPIISPPQGSYSGPQSITITAGGSTSIRYTTNGATPTASSTLYTGSFAVSSTTTVKAIAFASGIANSDVATAVYTISGLTVANPTFSIPGGSYTGTQTVTLACTTSGAQINYTLDGSTPSTVLFPSLPTRIYSTPISLTATTTIKAVGIKVGSAASSVVTATYNISQTSETLVFSDEFNGAAGTAPDGSKWAADTGAGWDNGNNAAYYTPFNRSGTKNMYQDGLGNLIIEARQEDGYPGAQTFNGHQYTAGRMRSIATWLGGRLEWRAKFDSIQSGVWPALWTYNNGTSTTSGYSGGSAELDMIEIFGSNAGNLGEWHNHVCDSNSGTISNDTTNWHVYSLEWRPASGGNKIEYKLDGNVVRTGVSCSTLNTTRLFPIMNVALTKPGASFGWNQITSGFTYWKCTIDYVRLYQ
jgi:hypothetical protein